MRKRQKAAVVVTGVLFALAALGILALSRAGSTRADAAAQPYQTGLDTVPKALEALAFSYAQGNACTQGGGSFSVSNAASTTLGAWKQMGPHAATLAAGGGIDVYQPQPNGTVDLSTGLAKAQGFFAGDSDTVFAVFLDGTCAGGESVDARVILNSNGVTVRLDAWQTTAQLDTTQPFSDAFDGQ